MKMENAAQIAAEVLEETDLSLRGLHSTAELAIRAAVQQWAESEPDSYPTRAACAFGAAALQQALSDLQEDLESQLEATEDAVQDSVDRAVHRYCAPVE